MPSPAGQGATNGGGAAARAIVIVGGGFGGLYTALALAARRDHPPLLLIEPGERFVFAPLLYEVLSGEMRRWEIAPRYDSLLAGQGVAWLQDRVEGIDTVERRVRTRGGRSLPYARLVIATGGRRNTFGVPGADAHALDFRSLADVDRIRELIGDLKRQNRPLQRLAVVGAGPTGVELACKLADLTAGSAVIELIEQGPVALPRSPAFNREQAQLALRRRDVRLRTHTQVTAVEPDRLLLRPSEAPQGSDIVEPVPVKGVIWTTGLRFQPPAITPPAEQDPRGRLLCEPDLRLRGHQAEFVAGDLAATAGAPAPTTAQVAFQQAPVLAANLLRSLAGEPLEPCHPRDRGEMLSLGVGEACLTALGLTLAGPAAYQLRRMAYLTRLPGRSHPWRVAAGWLADAGA
ncbi:MAG: FAD-dependent oxidoreductase [Synechococcaceae cyanobacterium]|nr:FAD-dependent oxidoreductase [Synechococcaceae cyanobacterium]